MNASSLNHLDDPFIVAELVDDEWIPSEPRKGPPTLAPPAALTPTGEELIFGNECDEPTRIYPAGYIEALLAEASVHTHGTVRSMKAVRVIPKIKKSR